MPLFKLLLVSCSIILATLSLNTQACEKTTPSKNKVESQPSKKTPPTAKTSRTPQSESYDDEYQDFDDYEKSPRGDYEQSGSEDNFNAGDERENSESFE